GRGLMTQALRDHTALLPRVEVREANPPLPGASTTAAIQAGVFWAVAGGIKALVRQLAARARQLTDPDLTGPLPEPPAVFLTGGDASLLAPVMDPGVIGWPNMTLGGIRLTAESLP